MASRMFFYGLTTVLVFGLVTAAANAGLVDATTSFSEATPWAGFDEDFSPDWKGKTTVVQNWVAPVRSWTTSFGTVMLTDIGATIMAANWSTNDRVFIPGHWETHSTVRKISSLSDTAALSSAWLRLGGDKYTATKNDSGGSAMARYATLVSPRGTLLANASAIAYQNTSFGDDEFSADGRVSAMVILANAAMEPPAAATVPPVSQLTVQADTPVVGRSAARPHGPLRPANDGSTGHASGCRSAARPYGPFRPAIDESI